MAEVKHVSGMYKNSEGEYLRLVKENPRRVYVLPGIRGAEEVEDGKIIRLKYENGPTLAVGEQFKINGSNFKPLVIKQEFAENELIGHSLYSQKLTKTSNYIMPFLGDTALKWRWNKNFVNAFLGIEGEDTVNEHLYLQYEWSGGKDFVDFEGELQKHPLYEETIDIDTNNMLYKLRFPEEYLEEINRIILGNYSKIKEKNKEKILKFHGTIDIETVISQIIYKSEARRRSLERDLKVKIPPSAELFDRFNFEEEMYLLIYKLD